MSTPKTAKTGDKKKTPKVEESEKYIYQQNLNNTMKRALILVLLILACLNLSAQKSRVKYKPVGIWTFEAPTAPEGSTAGDVEITTARKKYSIKMSFKGYEYKFSAEDIKFAKDSLQYYLNVDGTNVTFKSRFERPDKISGVAFTSGVSVPFVLTRDKNKTNQKKPVEVSQSKNLAEETSKNSSTDGWVKPKSITVTCSDYDTVKTEHGVLTNNVWNKQAANNKNWSQCIEKKTDGDKTIYGWSWSWPYVKRAIYGYPQIKVGSSPWAPEPKFDNRFPMEISQLEELNVYFDVEISSNGNYNLATSMWLISEPNQGLQPNKSIIAAEIMFWTYATKDHFNPAGQKSGEVTVGGENWEVWFEKNWTDASGVNKNRWAYITFKAKNSAFKTNINALELLRYAIHKKLISNSLFIADIELGNEVMSGEGMTWVKDFNIHSVIK